MTLMQRKEGVKGQRVHKYKKATHILANMQGRDKFVSQKQESALKVHTIWSV